MESPFSGKVLYNVTKHVIVHIIVVLFIWVVLVGYVFGKQIPNWIYGNETILPLELCIAKLIESNGLEYWYQEPSKMTHDHRSSSIGNTIDSTLYDRRFIGYNRTKQRPELVVFRPIRNPQTQVQSIVIISQTPFRLDDTETIASEFDQDATTSGGDTAVNSNKKLFDFASQTFDVVLPEPTLEYSTENQQIASFILTRGDVMTNIHLPKTFMQYGPAIQFAFEKDSSNVHKPAQKEVRIKVYQADDDGTSDIQDSNERPTSGGKFKDGRLMVPFTIRRYLSSLGHNSNSLEGNEYDATDDRQSYYFVQQLNGKLQLRKCSIGQSFITREKKCRTRRRDTTINTGSQGDQPWRNETAQTRGSLPQTFWHRSPEQIIPKNFPITKIQSCDLYRVHLGQFSFQLRAGYAGLVKLDPSDIYTPAGWETVGIFISDTEADLPRGAQTWDKMDLEMRLINARYTSLLTCVTEITSPPEWTRMAKRIYYHNNHQSENGIHHDVLLNRVIMTMADSESITAPPGRRQWQIIMPDGKTVASLRSELVPWMERLDTIDPVPLPLPEKATTAPNGLIFTRTIIHDRIIATAVYLLEVPLELFISDVRLGLPFAIDPSFVADIEDEGDRTMLQSLPLPQILDPGVYRNVPGLISGYRKFNFTEAFAMLSELKDWWKRTNEHDAKYIYAASANWANTMYVPDT